jgi:hypothetical protein
MCNAENESRAEAAAQIAAGFGARRAELAALQWTDLRERDADHRLGDRNLLLRLRRPQVPRRATKTANTPALSRSTPTPSRPSLTNRHDPAEMDL